MISTACRCGLRLSTDDGNLGRQVACPGCRTLVDFDGATTADREDAGHLVLLSPIEPEAFCPGCGGHDTIGGYLRVGRDTARRGAFVPDGLGLLARFVPGWFGVPFESACRCCLSCGLAWSSVDLEALRTRLRKHGDAASRARWAGPAPKPSPEADLA